jgi:hypothetical protein
MKLEGPFNEFYPLGEPYNFVCVFELVPAPLSLAFHPWTFRHVSYFTSISATFHSIARANPPLLIYTHYTPLCSHIPPHLKVSLSLSLLLSLTMVWACNWYKNSSKGCAFIERWAWHCYTNHKELGFLGDVEAILWAIPSYHRSRRWSF